MIATLLSAMIATAPTSVEVTVYNQGMGLVKETRSIELKAGRQSLAVEDVAAMIDPSSVSVVPIPDRAAFRVLEQNYQYDLISPLAILNKSVGQRIRFVRTMGNVKEVLEGTLISAPTAIVGNAEGGNDQTYNGMVIRTDDGRVVLNPTGEIEVKTVPAGLISVPTLVWDVEAAKAGTTQVELSYITNGMRWNSDYVLTLDPSNKASLQAWVTIDNQSGATYENAKLKLLAGDVNRPAEAPTAVRFRAADAMEMKAGLGGFQEESLFEYHLYTLQRPATVRNRERKQLALFDTAPGVPFVKKLIVDGASPYGRMMPNEGMGGTTEIKPRVKVEFLNKKESGLGIPLPLGRFRIYQRDASGSVQLLGEDNIDHTPRDERVSLTVGQSFDVRATRKRTNFRRISDRVTEESFEIEVRNQKDAAERVYVVEHNYGEWRVLEKSQEFTKLDASTLQFVVDLPAKSSRKVTYTIQSSW